MPTVRCHGTEIYYTVTGSGPWVTLSHSLACDHSMWGPQIAALSRRYTVLACDTRGHGQSALEPRPYSLEGLAEDVVGLLDVLGVARTHFVGLSMGGMIGQMLGLRHAERLASLTLACTTSRMPEESAPVWADRMLVAETEGMGPLVEPTLGRWFTQAFREAGGVALDHIAALIASTRPEGFVACAGPISRIDLTERLSAIRTPTLVIAGEQDPGTPPAMARSIAEAIPGARLEVIPRAAHLANVEQPEVFNHLLLPFLADHAQGDA